MPTLTPQIRNALIAALLAGNVELAYALAPKFWREVREYCSVGTTIDKLLERHNRHTGTLTMQMYNYIDETRQT